MVGIVEAGEYHEKEPKVNIPSELPHPCILSVTGLLTNFSVGMMGHGIHNPKFNW